MNAITIHRTRGVYPTRSKRAQGGLSLALARMSAACREFFERVDTDHSRNPSKKISNDSSFISKLLLTPPKAEVAKRTRIMKDFKTTDILRELLKNKWQRFCYFTYINRQTEAPVKFYFRFTRERILTRMVILSIIVSVFLLTSVSTQGVVGVRLPGIVADLMPTSSKPANWLTGTAEIKGSRYAVMGAYNYAQQAGLSFVADKADRDRLIESGSLVKLEGPYIRLVDVSEPYALPETVKFTNRLASQYAARGCGKLEVTSALRTMAVQKTLPNGSSYSVHPTGMNVDLRRIVPTNESEEFCLNWLEQTLLQVETERRIDVTAEDFPRHFHVVVEPTAYQDWYQKLKPRLDPEVEALAKALYFEASFNESGDGYKAIAAVIKNRAHSRGFPNTILEVVAQGAAGRSAGGCQFSFMCDGRAENPQLLCGQHPEETKRYWQGLCENRWEAMIKAAQYLVATKDDITHGAVLYYAASMDEAPRWAQKRVEERKLPNGKSMSVELKNGDFKPGTILHIGSHIFGCSNFRGGDVCAKGASS